MTLRLQVPRRAERDLDEAHAWYEQQLAGLGLRNAQGIQRVTARRAGPHGWRSATRLVRELGISQI